MINNKKYFFRSLLYLGALFFVVLITTFIQGLYFFLGSGEATVTSLFLRSVFIAATPVIFLPAIYWVSVNKPIFRNWKNVIYHLLLSAVFSFIFLLLFQIVILLFFRGEYLFALGYDRVTEILFRQFITIGSLLFFTYWGLVVLLGLDQYYRELEHIQQRSNELQAQLELATLSSLRAQLKPHFLFNTLSMVDQMIQEAPSKSIEIIDKLDKLLRTTFDRSTSECCTLEEEIEFIRKYLDIEKSRFQDRLDIDYDILSETSHFKIPRYLLQPLVENALVHGVANTMQKCTITIKSEFHEDHLKLSVEDNGAGLKRKSKKNFGIGLNNVKERLKLYFDDKAEFNLKTSVKGRTIAEILIHKKHFHQTESTKTYSPEIVPKSL